MSAHAKVLPRVRALPPLRNNPMRITDAAAARRQSHPREAAPQWLKAVRANPPAAPPLPAVVPAHVGHFGHAALQRRTDRAHLMSIQSPHRANPRSLTPVYTKKPPQIIFPEDDLRRRFYAQHPFEQTRPVSIVEDLAETPVAEAGNGGSPRVMTGEAVVQQTLAKMAANPQYDVETAYSLALAEFYTERRAAESSRFADDERKKAVILQKLQSLIKEDPDNEAAHTNAFKKSLLNTQVEWFREREAASLSESKKFMEQLEKDRLEKKVLRDKMAQFESRNLVKSAEEKSK
ncbi:hypothetical protein HDU84_005566 [Entophlyctis sp. JEL0112]|nr:hypothetical protein HDU84_005566 [Entophlyctis sp. JEL0112]